MCRSSSKRVSPPIGARSNEDVKMKIAVIGGIGSGKSEVMKVAKEMGITCLSADEINDALLHEPV